MYKILMNIKSTGTTMIIDKVESLFEACHRADIYKKKNPVNTYQVLAPNDHDIEYEV